jgi:hypothetical protein
MANSLADAGLCIVSQESLDGFEFKNGHCEEKSIINSSQGLNACKGFERVLVWC